MMSEIDIQTGKAIVKKEMKLKEEYLSLVSDYGRSVKDNLQNENGDISVLQDSLLEFREFIKSIKEMLQPYEYASQKEVLDTFYDMCGVCRDFNTLNNNIELFFSMLELFCQSVETLCNKYRNNKCRCNCCETEVIYTPLPDAFTEMFVRYGVPSHVDETSNGEAYACPVCASSDRDRMIASFLWKAGLARAGEDTKVLQIAPAAPIERWIKTYAPHVIYETTDLYMKGVTFRSDIMDMHMVEDETYDLIICFHVLEHVKDDRKALCELKRILKPNGLVVFLVPVILDVDEIDEEWGLSEEENWRRFGQGDHCRQYGKKGLMNRLKEQGFYINALGKDYFGEEIFEQLSLTDTSTLYVLTKDRDVELDLSDKYTVDRELLTNGPLVSVILSTYNHEEFVADAIESILNQTYRNIEFLVADDASTDGTPEVMKRYSEHFAVEEYFTENLGDRTPYLLGKATGKYVAIAHSDDFWEPDKLALQVDYLERHEDVAACFTWSSEVDENKNALNTKLFIQKNRTSCEWMKFFWRHGNALCHPSLVIEREEYFRLTKEANAYRQLPDYFMWIDLVQHANIYVLPKVLVKMTRFQNVDNKNVSASTKRNRLRATIEAAAGWNLVIRRMDNSFFTKAFHDFMRNPDAKEDIEIICEKFFLMAGHENELMQANAIQYFLEVFDDEKVRETFSSRYSFTAKDIWKYMEEKGYAKFFWQSCQEGK